MEPGRVGRTEEGHADDALGACGGVERRASAPASAPAGAGALR